MKEKERSMGAKVNSGLDNLYFDKKLQEKVVGNVGYLCHSASLASDYRIGIFHMREIFGDRLKCLFSPQHGLVGDVQDNMVESDHYKHPYFGLKVYSLYSETRIPTDSMLEGLDTVVIDLQDVGTRIYTYVYTMTHMMEACGKKGIKVVVLDRPNPVECEIIEGNMLEPEFASFVGRHPCPTRHALTIGEFALMAKKFWGSECELEVISMKGYKRNMSYEDTGLPWAMPSPNFPTIDSGYPFIGTVLFEGTNISEGRGTTRSLEYIGHPGIEPYSLLESKIKEEFDKTNLEGFVLRPVSFLPTFQKHAGKGCGGYQIHITDRQKARPWAISQILCKIFYHHLGADFEWKQPPYEYVHDKLPIDIINGTTKVREWIEKNGDFDELKEIEIIGQDKFTTQRREILLY
jgi:uncharacterized protein YbbC (DUF1343 family)